MAKSEKNQATETSDDAGNEQRFTLKSARMGGADNLYVDPVHIPINYDNVYVNDVQ